MSYTRQDGKGWVWLLGIGGTQIMEIMSTHHAYTSCSYDTKVRNKRAEPIEATVKVHVCVCDYVKTVIFDGVSAQP